MAESFRIKSIKAQEILNSKGNPTVKAELITDFGSFFSSVPSGVSTGKYEAVELRDEDGRGVLRAIENIEKVLAPVLVKEDLSDQKKIDEILIALDGTKNKSRLGANAILPVSIAVCRALAFARKIPLYRYIHEICNLQSAIYIPKPSFNMIEGGKHSHSTSSGQAGLAFQEFMAIPQGKSFKENFETGKIIYKKLGEILKNKFKEVILSAEGAFSAPVGEISRAIDFILEAAEAVGKKENIKIAIDAAASEFFENDRYKINGRYFSKEELAGFYKNLIEKYPIASIEDPFFEDDFEGWKKMESEILILGDDLTTTNLERMKIAKENNLCNAVIIKPNQIGTVTEAIGAAKLAKSFGWKIMVSNRAEETEDDFIADLAVGIRADFIKSGAPFPKERMAKYERLVAIEKEIGVSY